METLLGLQLSTRGLHLPKDVGVAVEILMGVDGLMWINRVLLSSKLLITSSGTEVALRCFRCDHTPAVRSPWGHDGRRNKSRILSCSASSIRDNVILASENAIRKCFKPRGKAVTFQECSSRFG
ncbi:hypothetical protein AAG570_002638 [Ranatra chinensis]|uniref:Uncharacterized protein n=1 Tax=Ranatra chinensis TaxID=642074 RepID=A0ABD0Y8I5_9HEMI